MIFWLSCLAVSLHLSNFLFVSLLALTIGAFISATHASYTPEQSAGRSYQYHQPAQPNPYLALTFSCRSVKSTPQLIIFIFQFADFSDLRFHIIAYTHQ